MAIFAGATDCDRLCYNHYYYIMIQSNLKKKEKNRDIKPNMVNVNKPIVPDFYDDHRHWRWLYLQWLNSEALFHHRKICVSSRGNILDMNEKHLFKWISKFQLIFQTITFGLFRFDSCFWMETVMATKWFLEIYFVSERVDSFYGFQCIWK